jgi:hypothetical protein
MNASRPHLRSSEVEGTDADQPQSEVHIVAAYLHIGALGS